MTKLTIQVFQNGEPVGEYIANVNAPDEQSAVDAFIKCARIDLRYRFLGHDGILNPSFPNDYLAA